MKAKRIYTNEEDIAVMDLSAEFDNIVLRDMDFLDIEAKADLDFDEDEQWY